MKASREESLTQPYVLEPGDLENLCERLQNWIPNFKFEITSKDSLKREFASLVDLRQFENSPSKDIQILRIRGYSEDLGTRVWFRFDKDQVRNISVSIEGDEETVMAINELFEERLTAMKPWYAFLARQESALLFWCLLLLVFVVVVIGWLLAGRITGETLSKTFVNIHWLLLIIPFIFGIIMARVFDKVKITIFPMGVFSIGQGAKRHKDKEILRTWVVIGFFISLLSSVIVTLIFAL